MLTTYLLFGLVISLGWASTVAMKLASMQAKASLKYFICMACGLSSYGVLFVVYSFVLRNLPLSEASPILSISGLLFSVVLGVVFFKERFRKLDALALCLGIVAIYILVS